MLNIAEVFRHRQPRQGDAQTRPRRLIHLTKHQRCLIENAGLVHFVNEVIALTGTLAHTGEDRDAPVVLGDALNHLLDEDRLTDARTTEEADLTALNVGGKKVDDLDARLEHLRAGLKLIECRGLAVNRPTLGDLEGLSLGEVEGFAGHVEDVALRYITDGNRDRGTRIGHLRAADESIRRLQSDGPDEIASKVLGNLESHREGGLPLPLARQIDVNLQSVVQRRDAVRRELDVDDRSDDSGDAPLRDCFFLAHVSSPCPWAQPATSASAPPTISLISWVMSA